MKIKPQRHRGSVLPTTLMIVGLVGLMLGAQLTLVTRQNYFNARSQVWASELPLAEAGIEEALAHLNSTSVLATNGWTQSGTNVVKTRYFGNDYFFTAISLSTPPTIVSVGFGRVPLSTNYTRRVVAVTTTSDPPGYGIVARQTITLGSSATVDSYNSKLGPYSVLTRKDGAGVATLSTATPAINTMGGKIYGHAATGPGGSAQGTIGDGAWIASGATTVQPGHFRDDFNMAIPDVSVPFSGALPPPSGKIGTQSYAYLLTGGDYQMATCKLKGNDCLMVVGKTRLYIEGDLSIIGNASIEIAPGASLELYLGGDVDVIGHGIINRNGQTDACEIRGLPTCTTINYQGTSDFIGRLYAPQAEFVMSGTPDAYGAFVVGTFSCTGTIGIHYDEALGTTSRGKLEVASWEEL